MISSILSRLVILLFGTLYPAYSSYKAVRTKNVKEYVKWMMYWIVFALFTCIETFTDVFLSWFPFYYEIKIILVIWLLSPATKGSSILYRKFVHPTLSSKEQEIDEYITKAKEQSYKQVLDFGSKGVSAIMQTALKSGGGLVNQLKKSYSLSDLTDTSFDETDADVVVSDARLLRRRRSPHTGAASKDIYFGEVDVRADRVACLQSAEDVSSGYSSGEGLSLGKVPQLAGREGLQRAGSLTRSRTSRATRSNVPRKGGLSEESDDNDIFHDNIIFIDGSMKTIDQLGQTDSSSSETEFLDTLEHVDSSKNLNSDRHTGTHPVLTACEGPALGKSLVDITKNVHTFSNFLQDLIETKNSGDSPAPSGGEKCKRGGRYNKRAAPPVPPIKATLVLKPGMVKTLGGASEVFVAPPRSRSRLGGKFGLWGKDRQRASWHCEGGDQSAMAASRSFSKSDSDLGVSDLGVLRGSRSVGRLRHLGK